MALLARSRSELRRFLTQHEARGDPRRAPWEDLPDHGPGPGPWARYCIICGWHGHAFEGRQHVERSRCPHCGSIGRDRFLVHCWLTRTRYRPGERVLETSPRLGRAYREVMAGKVDYRASDFDEVTHVADIKIDLQAIDLPDESLDTVLTPHVLEHVPDYRAGLAELHRVLVPGGVAFIQVPILQGSTGVPTEPEFHEDNTPVLWRFGFDLVDDLRAAGFTSVALVPDELRRRVSLRDLDWARSFETRDFDPVSIVEGARPEDLIGVCDVRRTRRFGFEPVFMYVTFEARRTRA